MTATYTFFYVGLREKGRILLFFSLMYARGIREELHDMVRLLATSRYFVVPTNPYYRARRDVKYGLDALEHRS